MLEKEIFDAEFRKAFEDSARKTKVREETLINPERERDIYRLLVKAGNRTLGVWEVREYR